MVTIINKTNLGKVSKSAIEEISKVNVLTDRVKKRRDEYLAAKVHVCSERSRLVTESWKETEGQSLDIRRAKLFQKMLEGLSVSIRDGELIVGSQTKYIRGASPAVDFSSLPVFQIAQSEKATASSPVVVAELSDEDREQLQKDAEYWKGRAPGDVLRKLLSETVPMIAELDDYYDAHIFIISYERSTHGKYMEWSKVLRLGFNGVIQEIKDELAEIKFTYKKSLRKYELLNAGIICCEAVITFANRYAQHAKELAKKESEPVRKSELEKIAEHCEWSPANPPRTFHEALQAFWLTWLAFNLESASHSEAAGRMDQYLNTFYEKDISEGRITRQEAAELMGCLWVKFNEMETIKGMSVKQLSQGSQFQDVTMCGVTQDGKDATNELSFLMLEVAGQLKMPQPPLYLRYHRGISEDIMIKALETNREHGAGIPCFINDEPSLLKLTSRGIPLTDARDYITGGCVGMQLPTGPNLDGIFQFNPAKVFELTLNNGIDPGTGKKLGPETGDPKDFKSYEELYDAWMKQLEYHLDLAHALYHVRVQARGEYTSYPFNSIMLDDCIKKGKGYQHGGTRYPQMAGGFTPIGHQNVSDSLVVIKKLVFEEKKITMSELLDALAVNFEGKEDLRQMLLNAPKYGNDEDYPDNMFNDVTIDITKMMAQHLDWQGYPMYVMRGGGSGHFWGGMVVGALPDGRKAYEATADGSLSPVQGMDTNGPTAVMLSASKINHMEYAMTTLLNMKLMPTMVQTKDGIKKVIALIKTFFDRGGWHVQFNMVDQKILIEAQKHPEQYRNLIVRVGGYSAFFVDLTKEIQDDIINRTQHAI
jgi:pyruvate formate-lyase/glycerol dehydratase family glycyl radical enzyme